MAILNTFQKNNRKVQLEKDNNRVTVTAMIECASAPVQRNNAEPYYVSLIGDDEYDKRIFKQINNVKTAYRCRRAREMSGTTLTEVATKLGYALNYVSMIETGNSMSIPDKFIKHISNISGVSEAYLKNESDKMYDKDVKIELYTGNDVEKATMISKLYLNSELDIRDFKSQINKLITALDTLQLEKPLQAALA